MTVKKQTTKIQHKNLASSIAQVFGFSVLSIQCAHAGGGEVFEVNSTSDQTTTGLITLREAIEQANLTTDSIIQFDPAVFSGPQTITLEHNDLLITSSVTINGPGADLLKIDGNGKSRIFTVDDGEFDVQEVNINNLTLSNGDSTSDSNNLNGGCIVSLEQLSVNDSKITGCTGEDGGGIWSRFGQLTIGGSEVINNIAENRGGGIFGRGPSVLISHSTISRNKAERGIDAGGGVSSSYSDIEIINSTISENEGTAAGILMLNNRSLTLVNTTVFNNLGVGIDAETATVYFSNSLIVGHALGDCVLTEIDAKSNNQNNMDTDGSCNEQATNHITISDPMLEPLAYFGGDTLTHRPLPGSPVIDIGNDSLCAEFDQRGEERPQDGDSDSTAVCDIGAIELKVIELVPQELIFKDGFDEFICNGFNRGC